MDLPSHIDGEDAQVCREVLLLWQEVAWKMGDAGKQLTVGLISDVMGKDMSPAERRLLLRVARKNAGLEDPDTIDALERMEMAQRAAAIRSGQTWGQEVRLAYTPSGALIDLDEAEADAAAERARAASLAARRAAEQADQAVEVERAQEAQRAADTALASELPPVYRGVGA
jgi:hypothetical protein